MRFFKKKLEDVMDALEVETQVPATQQISDVLCTRDSYFHTCWLRLKLLRPELIQEMGDIELWAAGYETSKDEEETEDTEEEDHGTII